MPGAALRRQHTGLRNSPYAKPSLDGRERGPRQNIMPSQLRQSQGWVVSTRQSLHNGHKEQPVL